MTIQQKIERLIPNIQEDFLTFPLHEEGDYRPSIKIWKITEKKLIWPDDDINKLSFLKNKYEVIMNYYSMNDYSKHTFEDILNMKLSKTSNKYMYEFNIFNTSDVLTNPEYNLDEMLDVAYKLINFKN